MTDTMHTPGPWKYFGRGDGSHRIYAPDGISKQSGPVAQAFHRHEIAERIANARLIAAAPDLLATAKALLAERSVFTLEEAADEYPHGEEDVAEVRAVFRAMRAAVARAEQTK